VSRWAIRIVQDGVPGDGPLAGWEMITFSSWSICMDAIRWIEETHGDFPGWAKHRAMAQRAKPKKPRVKLKSIEDKRRARINRSNKRKKEGA
jgi:hypothetical protein